MSNMPKAEVYMPILGFVRTQIIVNSVIVFLVLVVVSLRVVGRLLGPGLGWDDALVLLATPLGMAMLVCQGLFAPVGNGYTLSEHPELALNIPFILHVTFGMQIIYVVMLAAVKGSMLCFFLRVFVTPNVKRITQIMLGFVVAWMVAYIGACVFLCTPISGQWTGMGKCGEYIPMIQSLIATNAIGDLIIMTIPMYSIWQLKMRNTEKLGVTASFGLGIACIVCAVFRIIYISVVDLNSNITGTMPTTTLLFTLEPNLAILCVSIPMLRPFYVMYRKYVNGSRIQDTDERSAGFRDTAQKSTGTDTVMRVGDADGWEMDNYGRPLGKGSHHITASTTIPGADSESGSEKNLTHVSRGLNLKNEILVEQKWTVTRD